MTATLLPQSTKPYETFHRPQYQPFDWGVAVEVEINNCYKLPDQFNEKDVIVDVGAHIGYFSNAVLRRGASRVHAFEAHPLNFARAKENLEGWGDRAILTNCAVWRSDGAPAGMVKFSGFDTADPNANTGGGTAAMQRSEGFDVPYNSLDSILRRIKEPIRLLKLDCEGSEYPILFTSSHLSQVQEIVAEVHPQALRDAATVFGHDSTGPALASYLNAQGFKAEFAEIREGWGYLFATRA